MSLNIGINNKKKLKNLRKMTKIPKKSYNNYYSYKYSGEPSYNSCEHENIGKHSFFNHDFLEDSKCCFKQMMGDNKYKTLAIAGAGVSLGLLGIYMLKKTY